MSKKFVRLPHLWLMTDRHRLPDITTLSRLPTGSGVVLRDYDAPQRETLAVQLLALAEAHDLLLVIGRDVALAQRLGCGFHAPAWARPPAAPDVVGPRTAAAHNENEVTAAADAGFDAIFIAPVFATQSHINTPPLGVTRATELARLARNKGLTPLALGGMTPSQWQCLTTAARTPWHGFAAIDFFADHGKLKKPALDFF